MNLTNGFPNRFFGWGGEDSVMEVRLKKKKFKILEIEKGCTMETPKHEHDKGNEAISRAHRKKELKRENKLLKEVVSDGLSSIEYRVLSQEWMFNNDVLKVTVDI